jgi:DNA-binding NtrC family response regulator
MKKSPETVASRILVVDDSLVMLEVIKRNLSGIGHTVFTLPGVAEALDFLDQERVDLVITDLKMPRSSGLDLIQHLRSHFPDTETMIITGYPSIDSAVLAVKEGAEEYLVKPFTDVELINAVERVLIKARQRRSLGRPELVPPKTFGLIGVSEPMRQIFSLVEKAAGNCATVLISGESGTGKELVARAIHYHSDRRSAPFVPVNCTAIPEGLLESELFGHVKGAFTDARETRAGYFQIADGGTIFLDEIGDSSHHLQAKLLRVLESQEIFMVGSSKVQKINARILTATNKDLAGLAKKNLFREDLYYRLNIMEIAIPPLRDRGQDLHVLIRFFSGKATRDLNVPEPVFTDRAIKCLEKYEWPGNVRELENLVKRMAILSNGKPIEPGDLPAPMKFSLPRQKGFQRTLAEVEEEYIRSVLQHEGGSLTRTAEILGINRKTLRMKLRKEASS